ncbi:hypothetical protein KIL84_002611 [Mauremys mutica]|uniref:Uncharacterized protein n=1 Tax=Mauremys mutica TaxID=74926 RepID=A0A9D3X7V6_9SAUR|nr:hypothetical protein KIL84_002611 [Mauremys mutica]
MKTYMLSQPAELKQKPHVTSPLLCHVVLKCQQVDYPPQRGKPSQSVSPFSLGPELALRRDFSFTTRLEGSEGQMGNRGLARVRNPGQSWELSTGLLQPSWPAHKGDLAAPCQKE